MFRYAPPMNPKSPVVTFLSTRSKKEPHSPVNFWLLILLVLGLLAVAVGYFGNGRAPELETAAVGQEEERKLPSRTYTVTYKFGVFSPTNLRIRVGDTVTFKNKDSGGIHIIASANPQTDRPEFDSIGEVPTDSSFSYTFINEGVFAYHDVDDDRKAGVIIVRAP